MFRQLCVGGDRRGNLECELHGGAEIWSQATAIVQAEGEACAKWCEKEVSVPLSVKLQEGPHTPNLRCKCLGFLGFIAFDGAPGDKVLIVVFITASCAITTAPLSP